MIQSGAVRLLGCFYDREIIGFADLCKTAGYPTDLGGYYIRQLVRGNYLEKVGRGQYRLLPKGKQELAINYGRRLYAPRPRLGVLIVANRGEEFITVYRTVQPFIGTVEWPAGIVPGGEDLPSAAKRLAGERFGLEIQPRHIGFFRRIDRYEEAVFDDKLFAVHTCELPGDAKLAAETSNGGIQLHSAAELQELQKPGRALLDLFRYHQAGGGEYVEHIYNLSLSDLSPETDRI